jgi:hypothetical protein
MIIRKAYEDFAQGNVPAVFAAFDPSITWHVPGHSPLSGEQGGGATVTYSAQWLGPCAADQKPGDMIIANGTKMNIIEMQRRGGESGAFGTLGVPFPPR